MEKSNMKEVLSRVSIPGRIFDLLWTDDEFYREVGGNKKITSAGKFPRCDQWCDEEGFHMAFALAGYSPSDVSITIEGNLLCIGGVGNKANKPNVGPDSEPSSHIDEYPAKAPKTGVQQGMIVRGIARRNFRTKYFIHPGFNLTLSTASMKDGMLEVFVPRSEAIKPYKVNVKER
jgi:HSP20 family molecular chaperone IbpA